MVDNGKIGARVCEVLNIRKEGINMSEVENCPKCRGKMVEAHRLVARAFALRGAILSSVSLAKKGDVLGDWIIPFYCTNCGYIEFYKSPPAQYVGHTPKAFLKECVECGREIPIGSGECQHCGARQPEFEES
jgi:predicted nucleic-acid-binding Zn-ribbon protein